MQESLVDTMLRQPGARFCWQMTSQDHGLLACGQGVVDFPRGIIATSDRFPAAGDPESVGLGEDSEPPAVRTITTKDAVYVLAATDESEPGWLALETGSGGLASSVLAPLLWLRGSNIDAATVQPRSGTTDIVIDLRQYLEQLNPSDRDNAMEALDFSRIGLSTQEISATVRLGEHGLIERVTLLIPAGVSRFVPVGYQQLVQELRLEWLSEPPSIPTPDAQMRVSAQEFIQSTAEEAGLTWSNNSLESD